MLGKKEISTHLFPSGLCECGIELISVYEIEKLDFFVCQRVNQYSEHINNFLGFFSRDHRKIRRKYV